MYNPFSFDKSIDTERMRMTYQQILRICLPFELFVPYRSSHQTPSDMVTPLIFVFVISVFSAIIPGALAGAWAASVLYWPPCMFAMLHTRRFVLRTSMRGGYITAFVIPPAELFAFAADSAIGLSCGVLIALAFGWRAGY